MTKAFTTEGTETTEETQEKSGCKLRSVAPASLNAAYTKPSMRRRYEVWFLRLGLADGSGAWWLRYLLMNPGRGGCPGNERGRPVQVWATWFPRGGNPQSYIQGFSMEGLSQHAGRNALQV